MKINSPDHAYPVNLSIADGNPTHDTRLVEADDIADAIIEESMDYDMTVMATTRTGRFHQFIGDSITSRVGNEAKTTLLSVHRRSEDRESVRTRLRGET